MYERERYADAADGFQKALAQWPNDTMSWRLLGKTQMLMVDYVAAEKTYEELSYRTALTVEDQVNWAKCMMNQKKYAEAADALESLMASESTPEYVQKIWSQCANQLHVTEDDRHWEISALRFPGLETTSAPHITGDKLYFSSEPFRWGQVDHKARLDRNQMWALDLKPGQMHTMKARDVVAWDLPEHDGMVCLSPDAKAIAYSKKNRQWHWLVRRCSGRWLPTHGGPKTSLGRLGGGSTVSICGKGLCLRPSNFFAGWKTHVLLHRSSVA